MPSPTSGRAVVTEQVLRDHVQRLGELHPPIALASVAAPSISFHPRFFIVSPFVSGGKTHAAPRSTFAGGGI